MNPPIKVILADDHPVVRQGLKQILNDDPEFEVVSDCDNGRTALEQARALKPDVLLLDLDMPDMSGLDVATEILSQKEPFKVVILTMHQQEDLFNQALSLDVKGYVLKDSAATEIATAIRTVADGKLYISPAMSEYMMNRVNERKDLDEAVPGLSKLTASELRILKMIASDMTSKEIAGKLGLSPRTVENHRTNISNKLHLRGTHSLVKFAFENRSVL